MEGENPQIYGREITMKALACPRCDSTDTQKIADSPVKGRWEAYRCKACNYVWRSTEDLSNIAKKVKYWRETVVRFW